MLDEQSLRMLMIEANRIIAAESQRVIDELRDRSWSSVMPPGPVDDVLNPSEMAALTELQLSPLAISGLTKLVYDACYGTMFQFFGLLDGVADPELTDVDMWLGARICPPSEDDAPFLHDMLGEVLDDYEEALKRRNDPTE